MYDELMKRLREATGWKNASEHYSLMKEAADAIEELLKAAKAMHTWIFLNTGDEQAAYDECGLTDEMNGALGYSGQFVAEPPKEELMSRFPKDCWDKNCKHFHVTDMSIDDLLCACDVLGYECDARDEDHYHLRCPLAEKAEEDE